MKYGLVFLLLGGAMTFHAVSSGGLFWLLLWPGLSFLVVAVGYVGLGPRIFGKQATGGMAWYSVCFLLPYLLLTWFTWHLVRLTSREDCCNEVIPGLYIGRRPLAGEVPEGVGLLVDLTAEFPERSAVRQGREYICIPTLDASTMAETVLVSVVRRIVAFPGAVYIHCAQGHGRTGAVAAAVLLAKGHCATVEEAVQLLQHVRPRLGMNGHQMEFVRRVGGTDTIHDHSTEDRK